MLAIIGIILIVAALIVPLFTDKGGESGLYDFDDED